MTFDSITRFVPRKPDTIASIRSGLSRKKEPMAQRREVSLLRADAFVAVIASLLSQANGGYFSGRAPDSL
jgi:hypothetical protein